jgi:polygalacturonase
MIALALLLIGPLAQAQTSIFSANQFGAKGDGTTLDTAAIQKAIDAAAPTQGVVVFTQGTYLTGSIFVKTGVHLQIDRGVTLLGSQNIKDYPVMPSRIAGIEMSWPAALVNVYKQNNASITGEGTIDGDGKVFWDSYWTLRKGYETRGLRWASDYDAQRPRLIQIFDSDNVSLGGGLNLKRSGFWTVHICFSSNVTVDGVIIRNNESGPGGRGPSTDGIDIDSSKKVLVAHADIEVNDDALCLKAGRDSDGLRVNRPTEDVVLRDSIIRDGAAAVTFGSETSGGFRNIEAYNLTAEGHVPVGILFKSAHTRGGWGENIRIHDLTLTGIPTVLKITMNWNPSYSYAAIPATEKNYPAYWKVLATPVPDEKGRAHFHDVHIWNIKATGAKEAFAVDAFTQVPVNRFTLDHLKIQAASAGHIYDAKGWKFSDDKFDFGGDGKVALFDATDITGIESKPGPAPKDDAAKKSFAEQDKK